MKQKLTDQNKIDIVERYKNGETSVMLGKDFGVSHVAILGVLKVRGVGIRKRSKKGGE